MGGGARSPFSSYSPTSKPKTLDLQWVPLQNHPVFNSRRGGSSYATCGGNLAAWDAAASRLFSWDPHSRHLHRLSLRFSSDDGDSGEAKDDAILAAVPSEVLTPDIPIKSAVDRILLNADGSSLLLAGPNCVYFVNLYEKASSSNGGGISYRTSTVGSQVFSAHNNGLRILQVSWHPYSSSHVGILSSDTVLRLFDLSSDLERPEQEFYLQPFDGTSHSAMSICPVAFSFGGQHLWDRFSIFVLFSDGSTYVLCPIIPFGSVCSWAFLEELHEDVKAFGLQSSNIGVISSSKLALDWLESTFPELADKKLEEHDKLVLRAHPYALLDASLALQGPLGKVRTYEENDNSIWNSDYEAKATSLLYSSIGKDSVLMIGWGSGQLQIDALADEIQPLWSVGSAPRLRVDSNDHIKGVAMICESNLQEKSAKLSYPSLNSGDTAETVWLGPPLLRLATVDLSLPRYALDGCSLALFSDPLLAEKFYCLHAAGIDLISLHFLPFSSPQDETDKIEKAPSVFPILANGNGEAGSTSALCGFVAISNTYGHSQLVGITPSYECIVLESKLWSEATPLHYSMDILSAGTSDSADIPEVISKELLSGPTSIVVPTSTTLRFLTADSIEGRSTLHQYIKLFHENYVEYAHKVFVELEHHGNYLKTIIDNQTKRFQDVEQLLLTFQCKEQGIEDRISRAFKVYELLEQRLQNFGTLPGANKKPLTKAEHEFKDQLEGFADMELDALRSSIKALNARLSRCYQPSPGKTSYINAQLPARRRNQVSDAQIEKIRSSLEMLSVINNENTKKLSIIEQGLKRQEE